MATIRTNSTATFRRSIRASIGFPTALALSIGLTFTPLLLTGCGKQEVAQATPATPTATSPEDGSAAQAEAVVSAFLDRIRRGGQDNNAMSLLTDRAQAELQRVGQVVQPIGSPDAQFKVTRSTPMPRDPKIENQADGRLVHCLWSEPAEVGANGQTATAEQYQVVWSVIRQHGDYKISGLILEMDPNEAPMILDFEDGDLMARVLGGQPAAQTAQSPSEPESNVR